VRRQSALYPRWWALPRARSAALRCSSHLPPRSVNSGQPTTVQTVLDRRGLMVVVHDRDGDVVGDVRLAVPVDDVLAVGVLRVDGRPDDIPSELKVHKALGVQAERLNDSHVRLARDGVWYSGDVQRGVLQSC